MCLQSTENAKKPRFFGVLPTLQTHFRFRALFPFLPPKSFMRCAPMSFLFAPQSHQSSTRLLVDAPDFIALRRVFLRQVSLSLALAHNANAFAHDTKAQNPSVAASFENRDAFGNRETDLIERAQNGDLDAFDSLVASHQNRVFNLCKWNLGNDDDASDAAQDVFVRAWRAIARFRGDCAFSSWLHRIAINVISDCANKRRRAPLPVSSLPQPGAESDDWPELETPDLATESNPQEAASRHVKQRAVRNALAGLPQNQRAVLVLFDVQGQSYEEVAAVLELPLGTVKSRLSRARLALRAQLETCRELWDD